MYWRFATVENVKCTTVRGLVDLKLTSYKQRPHHEGLYYFETPGDIRVKVTNEEGGLGLLARPSFLILLVSFVQRPERRTNTTEGLRQRTRRVQGK